jgi:aspartate aminotransferase
MRPSISSRGRAMPASPIRKLMPLADEARRRGTHVFHLNIGQPDLETPPELKSKLAAVDRVIAYTPSGGTPEYLAALQGYYAGLGLDLPVSQLLATTAGSEAILFALFATTSDGDEALVCEPYYTNYNSYATMAGVRLVPLTTRGEDGFHLPPREDWERALTPRTRLVLLCNPNNPTGTVLSRAELEMVAQFCRDHGLFLISDEVYREFVYDGRAAISALSLPGFEEQVILVDSLSKRFSACGIRLGCLATRNAEVHQACLRMAQGRLSPPGLAQLMATGIPEIGPAYYEAVRAEYQARRDFLFEEMTKIPGVFLRKPEGAFYFVARLPVDDAEEFARFLLADFSHDGTTVMVAPAAGFYATPGLGRDEVRIAYVLRREDLERAVAAFAAGLRTYREKRGLDRRETAAGRVAEEATRFQRPLV